MSNTTQVDPIDAPPKVEEASPAMEAKTSPMARFVDAGIVIALFAMIVVGLVGVPGFGTGDNIKAILFDSAFLGIVAVGMTFVVVSGNFLDLSVVAQVGAAAVVVTLLEPYSLPVAFLGAAFVTLIFAAVNTLGVGVMRANGVVVTLAVQTAGFGALLYATGGAQYNGQSPFLNNLTTAVIGPVPVVFIIMVLVGLIAEFVLVRTNLGLSIRSVGTKLEAARIAGMGPARSIGAAYVAVALSTALAGGLLAGFNNNALPTMGTDIDFEALAAVIIGGTSLFGGRGSALRTLVGVMFVGILLNISVLLGLPFEWQQFVKGLIIVVAVAGDALLRRKGLR